MIKTLSRKAGFVLAVAGAAVIGGATTAIVAAAIPSSTDGQIHGCYRNNASLTDAKGALRVIDSDAAQICTAQETALDLSPKRPAIVKDANGQVLGDLLNADGQLTSVYNHTINRVIKITYDSDNDPINIGQQTTPAFETSDCTGQAYNMEFNPTLSTKTTLYWWTDGTNRTYGVVNNNAILKTIGIASILTTNDNINFYCQSGVADLGSMYPFMITTLPFSAPVAPFKF